MASNPEEDIPSDKPSTETTGETETPAAPAEQKTTSEPEVDYKVKFSESSKEAQRLLEQNKKMEKDLAQTQDVMEVLYENPELLQEVQTAYTKKGNPASEPAASEASIGIVPEKVLDAKVQKAVSPLKAELETERQQRVEESVRTFSEKHPDAAEGTDTWKKILEWLPAMHAKGLPLKQGLEKAHEIVTIDNARSSGKLDALRGIFEKQQAAVSGGSSGAVARERSSEIPLTSEEEKVAANLGISSENYQKRKNSS